MSECNKATWSAWCTRCESDRDLKEEDMVERMDDGSISFQCPTCTYYLTVGEKPKQLPAWIKCGERLPEDGQEVLCFISFEAIGALPFITNGFRNGSFWMIGTNRFKTLNGPSHWMPLPEPPKE